MVAQRDSKKRDPKKRDPNKRRVAILGGGASGLTTAFWLTQQPGWSEQDEVTVYQVGWRLGGKSASSRNPDRNMRSEEHGYHVLLGFYENAFRTLRAAYDELDRDENQPFSRLIATTAEEERQYPDRYALHRHTDMQIAQPFGDDVHFLPFDLPDTGLLPGDGYEVNPWSILNLALSFLWRAIHGTVWAIPDEGEDGTVEPADKSWWGKVSEFFEEKIEEIEEDFDAWLSQPDHVAAAEAVWKWIAERKLFDEAFNAAGKVLSKLIKAIVRKRWKQVAGKVESDWETYRDWIVLDSASAVVCGMLDDELFTRGFGVVDDINYVDWWMKHAAVPEGAAVTVRSSLAQLPYDLVFGFQGGDTTSPRAPHKPLAGNPQMGAGTMLKGMLRFAFDYKGTPEWMFQAGCGEVLCAPMYEVLTRRGVKFEFFTRVHSLHLDDRGERINRVRIEKQATPKTEYTPLFDVDGIPCWPLEPFYDQLEEGAELKRRGVNLEQWWTDWQGEMTDLVDGEDFDEVVLAIPCVAYDQMCAELAAASPKWAAMLDAMKTNRPLVVQAWYDATLAEMGWHTGTINGDTGAEPINLLTSMNQIIAREKWDTGKVPKALIYYSGVFPDDPSEPPPSDTGYPAQVQKQLERVFVDYLDGAARRFQPDAYDGDGFDWNLLATPNDPDLQGEARLTEQYIHVGITPAERYVLSVPGSGATRLAPSESGFANLTLAGDWTRNGMDAGCMEAAFTSGMLAAEALGVPMPTIVGVDEFN